MNHKFANLMLKKEQVIKCESSSVENLFACYSRGYSPPQGNQVLNLPSSIGGRGPSCFYKEVLFYLKEFVISLRLFLAYPNSDAAETVGLQKYLEVFRSVPCWDRFVPAVFLFHCCWMSSRECNDKGYSGLWYGFSSFNTTFKYAASPSSVNNPHYEQMPTLVRLETLAWTLQVSFLF